MRIIPRQVIRDWYIEEYSKLKKCSVYGSPVPAIISFMSIIKKDKAVKTVLELGCGDGRNLIELAKQGYIVTGIDLAGKQQVEYCAQKQNVPVQFITGDITQIPFEEQQYGAVICSEVFHLLSRTEVQTVLERMKIATKQGGYIYISILSNLKRFFLHNKEKFKYEHQSGYSAKEARTVLQQGFRTWNIIRLDTFHDEHNWPLTPGNYPLKPYHWSGDYVHLIAQKK